MCNWEWNYCGLMTEKGGKLWRNIFRLKRLAAVFVKIVQKALLQNESLVYNEIYYITRHCRAFSDAVALLLDLLVWCYGKMGSEKQNKLFCVRKCTRKSFNDTAAWKRVSQNSSSTQFFFAVDLSGVAFFCVSFNWILLSLVRECNFAGRFVERNKAAFEFNLIEFNL